MNSDPIGGIGVLLRLTWTALRDRAQQAATEAGFDDLSPAHLLVFLRGPTVDGLRPSELAALTGFAKQTINGLLHDLEQRGYVTRVRDPRDGRARRVRLTTRGRELEALLARVRRATERAWATRLGAERMADLQAALEEVAAVEQARGSRARVGSVRRTGWAHAV